MGGRTQRCSLCFRKVGNSLGPSQMKKKRKEEKQRGHERETGKGRRRERKTDTVIEHKQRVTECTELIMSAIDEDFSPEWP